MEWYGTLMAIIGAATVARGLMRVILALDSGNNR